MIGITEEFDQVHVLECFSQAYTRKDFNHISIVLLAGDMFCLSGLSQIPKYYDQKSVTH